MDIDYLDLCMVSYVTADQELDAHTQAASQIFGVPMAEVTPAQRRLAPVEFHHPGRGGEGDTTLLREAPTHERMVRQMSSGE